MATGANEVSVSADRAHTIDQFPTGIGFGKIAATAEFEPFLEDAPRQMLADEQDLALRNKAMNGSGRTQAIKAWETDIEENDVAFQLLGLEHGLTAVRGFARDLPVWLQTEKRDDPSAHNLSIFDDQDPEHRV